MDENKDKPNIYINEDLTKFRAALAKKARTLKNTGKLADSWTIYGKVFIKDNFGHVKVIKQFEELVRYN